MKIYVASSWRNPYQAEVVKTLQEVGHTVYDFMNPPHGGCGFHWRDVQPGYTGGLVSSETLRTLLSSPQAQEGFRCDWEAMEDSEAGVLVLPSGRSSHLEAGYFIGVKKPLHIYIPEAVEPELMYKMATTINTTLNELILSINPFSIHRPVVQ